MSINRIPLDRTVTIDEIEVELNRARSSTKWAGLTVDRSGDVLYINRNHQHWGHPETLSRISLSAERVDFLSVSVVELREKIFLSRRMLIPVLVVSIMLASCAILALLLQPSPSAGLLLFGALTVAGSFWKLRRQVEANELWVVAAIEGILVGKAC